MQACYNIKESMRHALLCLECSCNISNNVGRNWSRFMNSKYAHTQWRSSEHALWENKRQIYFHHFLSVHAHIRLVRHFVQAHVTSESMDGLSQS